ncbi:hypothetical protein [Kordiimonas aestuarii]|uniref:hypothetical protein n=1 Tax=Kordiimonas aestuarii TaxID=1005925 RepID=UPI0021CE4034|nr:hypothetical protein [Kordiimonas aestuarii]
MSGIAPIPQAALLALLKQPNMNAARLPDFSGSGRFQAELLSFQRAETITGQMNTQLVSTVRPSVFIPDLNASAACAQGTTQKRSEPKKKDKPGNGGHAVTPAPRKR